MLFGSGPFGKVRRFGALFEYSGVLVLFYVFKLTFWLSNLSCLSILGFSASKLRSLMFNLLVFHLAFVLILAFCFDSRIEYLSVVCVCCLMHRIFIFHSIL